MVYRYQIAKIPIRLWLHLAAKIPPSRDQIVATSGGAFLLLITCIQTKLMFTNYWQYLDTVGIGNQPTFLLQVTTVKLAGV